MKEIRDFLSGWDFSEVGLYALTEAMISIEESTEKPLNLAEGHGHHPVYALTVSPIEWGQLKKGTREDEWLAFTKNGLRYQRSFPSTIALVRDSLTSCGAWNGVFVVLEED